MATPAYYRNGVPYGADGRVIITITGGPVGPGSIAGTKTERPVYVGWPGMESAMSHGIGPVTHYDPHKSGHYSLESIREGQAQINELIIKAKNAHHYDDEKIVHDSMSLLESLNKSGLIHHAVLQAAAAVLQEAITALQENRLLRNKAGQDVNISTQAAVTAFEQFVQRDDIKMQNFRDARPFVFDFVLSISPVYRHIITLWNTLYLPKIQQEMEEKNNLVTYLDRVKIICTDIINKTESLNNEKVRIENAEQALKAQEERKQDQSRSMMLKIRSLKRLLSLWPRSRFSPIPL